ncbi:MAG: glycine-rich domain-containing protein-like [Alcaligenaceae bacterium]|nr:glycine-rich domain-containing protein-like [Alcaligenaceae bacterium]
MKAVKFEQAIFDRAIETTNAWNFELAIEKLLEVKSGQWDLNRAETAVQNYKRYMAVTKALGGAQLVPNGDIDEIWHMHILDTRAYMKDCNELFGEYLHHFPYFGMLGEENRQQWFDVQSKSESLWQELFGEALYSPTLEAQKCPQVCPCHIDQVASDSSNTSSMQKAA